MKVGDLVKQVCWDRSVKPGQDGVGIVVECQGEDEILGIYWRILFGSELNYICENDLEVISESR